MFNMGPAEITLIVLVFLLLFGAKRLPNLARSLGQGIVEFKKGLKSLEETNQITNSESH